MNEKKPLMDTLRVTAGEGRRSLLRMILNRAGEDAILSLACSMLLEQLRAESAAHDDVDAWHAPGECHALVSRGEAARMLRVLDDLELSLPEFERRLEASGVDAKWLYDSGLDHTIDLASTAYLARLRKATGLAEYALAAWLAKRFPEALPGPKLVIELRRGQERRSIGPFPGTLDLGEEKVIGPDGRPWLVIETIREGEAVKNMWRVVADGSLWDAAVIRPYDPKGTR